MRIIQRIGRMDLVIRHLRSCAPHFTVRKLFNLALNICELKFRIPNINSNPPYAKIELTPICQLRCPECSHSATAYKSQFNRKMQLTLDDFKKIVDPIKSTLLGICLSNRGEPMMGENLIPIIEYANKQNIAVSFPTNFSLKFSDDELERLCRSGLDTISISLDGASQETYGRYRVGGNFELVTENVRRLSVIKKKLGLKHPFIVWKFIIFEHNKHELDWVKNIYKKLGFDGYEYLNNSLSTHVQESTILHKQSMIKSRKPCYWPWHTIVIAWDGKVSPCCRHGDFELGNAIQNDTHSIWAGAAYLNLRTPFTGKTYGEEMNLHCRECMGISIEEPTNAGLKVSMNNSNI